MSLKFLCAFGKHDWDMHENPDREGYTDVCERCGKSKPHYFYLYI